MGDDAARAFLDFFTAQIRNPNTRAAYFRNVRRFLAWVDASGLRLETIEPYHVATFIEKIGTRYSAPTVKQHLAALRMLGSFLVIRQVLTKNPAADVRGPAHVVTVGKTPVLTSRECTSEACSPGAFKVKNGTGISGEQTEAFCPYCRTAADPNDFATQEQLRYAQDIAMREATDGVDRMISKAFGLGPTGKKKYGGGFVSMEVSYKPGSRPPVRRPLEEQFRRDVKCPRCTLEHAVYGLAVWCPDCGKDIFITHVEAECEVVRAMLQDVERRSTELGARVAARDIENGLEDVVSILEASLKALSRRKLLDIGTPADETESIMAKKVRNRYQGYEGAVETLAQLFQIDLTGALDAPRADRLKHTIEKRHPITHNLGIVDRKYLEKVRTGESEGRDVSLDEDEVVQALDTIILLIRFVHAKMFQDTSASNGPGL